MAHSSSPQTALGLTAGVLGVVAFATTGVHATVGWGDCGIVWPDPTALPHQPPGAVQICRHNRLAISYDVSMVNPAFSAYYVTPQDCKNHISGRLDFYEDPDLRTLGIRQPAVDSLAFNVSWNRGHLAPNRIMSFSEEDKNASFTMANVAPQEAVFNQHPWNELEGHVFDWVCNYNPLYIITGVMYKDRDHVRRTYDGLSVPDYFFKVLCDATNGQSVGFYAPNEVGSEGTEVQHPVADIERIYGGRLFPESLCNTTGVNQSWWW